MKQTDPLYGFTEAQVEKLEQMLTSQINSSDQAKGSLPERWAANRVMYHAGKEAEAPEVIEGMGGYVIPLWKPKANRIVNNTYGTITGLSPTVQCLDVSNEGKNIEPIEKTLDNIMRREGFNKWFKAAMRESLGSNIAGGRLKPKLDKKGKVVGLKLDVVYPEELVAYPVYLSEVNDLETVGMYFYKARYMVDELMQQGSFRAVDNLGPDTSALESSSMTGDMHNSQVMRGDPKSTVAKHDEPIRIYELVTEFDMAWLKDDEAEISMEGTRKYVVYFAFPSNKVMRIEPYSAISVTGNFVDYPKPWIAAMRITDERRYFWPQDSPANAVQDIQNLYSRIFTLIEQGGEMTAFGVPIITGGSLNQSEKRIKPGMIIDGLARDAKVEVLKFPFDPSILPQVLTMLSEVVDGLSGYGRLGSGEALPSGATATEAQALIQTMNEVKDEYVDAVAPTIEHLWEMCFFYLKTYYQDLKEAYGDLICCTREEVESANIRYEVTGTTSSSNMSTLLQKLMLLMQLADQDPQIDKTKVVKQIISHLGLSFSAETIMKPHAQMAAELMAQNGSSLEALHGQMVPGQQGQPANMEAMAGAPGASPMGSPPQGPPG